MARLIDFLVVINQLWGVIKVGWGSRMPGLSLHNLNASGSYEMILKWRVGLSAVMHSERYLRGNENNALKKEATQYLQVASSTTLQHANN